MKKRLLALLLTVTTAASLCACGNTAATQPEETEETTEEATEEDDTASEEATEEEETETEDDTDTEETEDYTGGSPWIDSNILSNVESAGEADVKDDFNLAINGQWVKDHPIQAGKTREGYLVNIGDKLNEKLIDIATDDSLDMEDHNAELVNDLYTEFLDWDARDAAGTDSLMPYLEEIEAIEDYDDLEAYSSKKELAFASVVNFGMSSNPNDSDQNIMYVGAPEFFLNDAKVYADIDSLDDYDQLTYDCAKEKVQTVLAKCGYTDDQIDAIFDGSIEFEKMVAQYCYTKDEKALIETKDVLSGQVYTTDEMSKYKWFDIVKDSAAEYGIDDVKYAQLYDKADYFDNMDSILSDDNMEIIRDYLLAHTASTTIQYLDKDTFYAAMDISNELNGSTGYLDEDLYAIKVVSGQLGWPLSKLYCDKYVTAEDKQGLEDIINDIIDEYQVMLKEEDFLSEATQDKAIEKIEKMRINCMYPDDWSDYDYSELELADNYFESMAAISEFEYQREMSKYNKPVDKDLWVLTPITVNAAYDPDNNSINILPGLVNEDVYNSEMSEEEAYGRIGSIVGHEISHAFDPNGSNYDADGNYANWWTDEDNAKFKEKTDKLVEYYNNISVWDGVNCNGEMNKTEACADMGGVAVMLRLAKAIPDFDYKEYFENFAEIWAMNATPSLVYYHVNYDVHPANYLRANVTVAQFDEFYEAFDVKEGDGMYIAPEDRVKIW